LKNVLKCNIFTEAQSLMEYIVLITIGTLSKYEMQL